MNLDAVQPQLVRVCLHIHVDMWNRTMPQCVDSADPEDREALVKSICSFLHEGVRGLLAIAIHICSLGSRPSRQKAMSAPIVDGCLASVVNVGGSSPAILLAESLASSLRWSHMYPFPCLACISRRFGTFKDREEVSSSANSQAQGLVRSSHRAP